MKEVIVFVIGFIAGAVAAAVFMRRKAKIGLEKASTAPDVEYKQNTELSTSYTLRPEPIRYEIK